MTVAALAPLPVLIPLIAAAATLVFGRRPRVQRYMAIAALMAVLAVSGTLLFLADRDGTTALQVGGWDSPIGITLVVDRLSAMMLVVSSIVLLAVMVYAVGQGIRDGTEDQPTSIFAPTYLALTAGISNAFLAGDLFNLYVGFEVLLAASFVLLTLGASADRVRAGVSYVLVSLVSSLIFLAGIAYAYAATGTLNLAQIAVRLQDVPQGVRTAIFAVLLVAFGIKAAVFPLSFWLPDSYPTAPAPVTAVFAGGSKTWLLIIDAGESSRMLSLDDSQITAEDGEPVEGEPTSVIDGDPEKTLKKAVGDLTGVSLDAVIADKGLLVIVED